MARPLCSKIEIVDVIREEREFLGLPVDINPDVYLRTDQEKRSSVGKDSESPGASAAESPPPAHTDAPWALCLSGGGIRSATFALGVLQGLGRLGELSKFHYLSTVSGGGYIGSWLSRWVHAQEGKLENVQNALAGKELGQHPSREPEQVRSLRAYSNYLSPVWGLSADFFTLVSILLRNLLLNWLVLVPLLFALVLVPRLYLGISSLEVPASEVQIWAWSLLAIAGALLVLGTAYVVADLPGTNVPDSAPRNRFPLLCFLPIAAAAALLGIVIGWRQSFLPEIHFWWYLIAGIGVHVLGCILGLVWRGIRGLQGGGQIAADVIAIVVSGAAGGAFVYAFTVWLPRTFDVFKEGDLHAVVAAPVLLFVFWLATSVYVALAKYWSSEDEREWWARSGGWWLLCALCWVTGFSLVIYVPQWIGSLMGDGNAEYVAVGGAWGILVAAIGYCTKNGTKITDRAETVVGMIGMRLLDIAAMVFLVGLVIAICFAVDLALRDRPPPLGGVQATSPKPSAYDVGKKDQHKSKPASVEDIDKAARAAEAAARVAVARITKGQKDVPAKSRGQTTEERAIEQASLESEVDTARRAAQTLAEIAPTMRGNLADTLKAAESATRAAETLAKSGQAVTELDPVTAKVFLEAQKKASGAAVRLLAIVDTGVKATTAQPSRNEYSRGLRAELYWVSTLFAGLLATSMLFSCFVGVNTFSLHSMYGNRLVRAYFGGARNAQDRTPHWFTGFDIRDNVTMNELQPASIPASDDSSPAKGGGKRIPRLLHVVNVALNLVDATGGRLEWQQRKAASFTVSKLHSGSDVVGFLPSSEYSQISLGRAMTISGAAASSNMGYHSSAPVALVMTFFNVRLGWWLPNPGYDGVLAGFVKSAREPRWALRPLLWEALSATTAQRPYLYLSDGGHFDNLGLYEMVRRGCRKILVSDASADPKRAYFDLQDTIRKIRVDFGISIDFEPHALDEPRRCVIGRIRYLAGSEGLLYYIKPTLCGDEPLDVLHYAQESRTREPKNAYPHQSTSDQFFNEAQFESYRLLGFHTVMKLWSLDGDQARWPDERRIAQYQRVVGAFALSGAGGTAAATTSATVASDDKVSGSGGLFSSLAQATQSMSQGAIVATALGVGTAVGVVGHTVVQDPKPPADSNRVPSKPIPPAPVPPAPRPPEPEPPAPRPPEPEPPAPRPPEPNSPALRPPEPNSPAPRPPEPNSPAPRPLELNSPRPTPSEPAALKPTPQSADPFSELRDRLERVEDLLKQPPSSRGER